jgi:tetratricopeptide (TPR) repeat protein
LAKIKRLKQQYPQAIKLLEQALAFYQGFRSDYGKTRALIELALIANAQKNHLQAEELFSQATVIADKNGVATNKVAILLAQAQVLQQQSKNSAAQQYAKKALSIATEVDNHLLIARVKAWLSDNPRYEIN